MFSWICRRFRRKKSAHDTATGELRVRSIREFFDTLEYRFVREAAKKAHIVFQYTITGNEPLEFYVVIDDGDCSKHLGRHDKPTCGIVVDSDDYVQMINGDMNPRLAYLRGKMKLVGRKMAAQKIQKMILIGPDAEAHYQKMKAAGTLPELQQPDDGSTDALTESLTAPYRLEFTYQRTTGPVIGRFLTGLREQRIEGVRCPDGRVIVPPTEYDPASGRPLVDTSMVQPGEADDLWARAANDVFVAVGPAGTVETWSWVHEPTPAHPLDRPFAFALIRLDGADTPILHCIEADRSQVATGMRVVPDWKTARVGAITDIRCFVPEEAA